jgi:hypothetical protein
MSRAFFRNAKIEKVQENRSEHALTCAVISPGLGGLFGVSEAAEVAPAGPTLCENSWGGNLETGKWKLEIRKQKQEIRKQKLEIRTPNQLAYGAFCFLPSAFCFSLVSLKPNMNRA